MGQPGTCLDPLCPLCAGGPRDPQTSPCPSSPHPLPCLLLPPGTPGHSPAAGWSLLSLLLSPGCFPEVPS